MLLGVFVLIIKYNIRIFHSLPVKLEHLKADQIFLLWQLKALLYMFNKIVTQKSAILELALLQKK